MAHSQRYELKRKSGRHCLMDNRTPGRVLATYHTAHVDDGLRHTAFLNDSQSAHTTPAPYPYAHSGRQSR